LPGDAAFSYGVGRRAVLQEQGSPYYFP